MQAEKRYHSASYLNSGAVFYGTLLFLVARIFTLIQLFSDAAARKGWSRRRGELTFRHHMAAGRDRHHRLLRSIYFYKTNNERSAWKRGNYYLLLNALFAV